MSPHDLMEDKANPVAAHSPYELRNLVEHLAQARRLDDLRRLLALETGNGRNSGLFFSAEPA